MKKLFWFLPMLILLAVLLSCDKINSILNDNKDPNSIAGDTNLPLNQVGNTVTTSVKVGNNSYNIGESIKIIKSENGVATYKVTADLTKAPDLLKINDRIPSAYKDASGKIIAEVKYKITSEGIQDYFNIDGKAHTIVKYDGNVGDIYQMAKSDGKTITRTVTAKSTNDDFPYMGMYIKTMTTEQDSRIPGVRKFVYRTNHKFGLVYVEAQLEDGSKASTYLYPSNY
ncbi:MAG: hypothetical protein WC879_11355 [Melioribacteraceae bacterium]